MDRKKEFREMLDMQQATNNQVDSDWVKKKREWYRAVWIECGELMEHYGGWKWWKKTDNERTQVLLELIDIWHFGLSILICKHGKEAAAAVLSEQWHELKEESFHISVEKIALSALKDKTFSIYDFCSAFNNAGYTFDNLYANYIGKNVLNKFRQDNGYKNGNYKKIWLGKEDNVILAEILDKLDVKHNDYQMKIYRLLDDAYRGAP